MTKLRLASFDFLASLFCFGLCDRLIATAELSPVQAGLQLITVCFSGLLLFMLNPRLGGYYGKD